MSFSIDTYKIPHVRSYDNAHMIWADTKPWRGDPDTNTRPLAGRNKRHMTIRKGNDGSIICRLHSTDVVRFHPDGKITIDPYQSVSTDAFANAILPNGLGALFNTSHGPFVSVRTDGDWYVYKITYGGVTLEPNEVVPTTDEFFRLEKGWRVVSKTEPMFFARVNRKRANETLKAHNFNEFRDYVNAVAAFRKSEDMKRRYWWPDTVTSDEFQLFQSEDKTNWLRLYDEYGRKVVEIIRETIYRYAKVADAEVVDRVKQSELQRLIASLHKNGRYVHHSNIP